MVSLAWVYVLAVFCVAGSLATPFSPCAEGPAPVALRVKNCEEAPCDFVRGEVLEAEWDFNVIADTDTLKPKAVAYVLGAAVPYPLPEIDGCDNLANGRCPLDEGELLTYTLKMEILKVFPKLGLSVEFSLLDDKGTAQVCFKVDAKVVDKE